MWASPRVCCGQLVTQLTPIPVTYLAGEAALLKGRKTEIVKGIVSKCFTMSPTGSICVCNSLLFRGAGILRGETEAGSVVFVINHRVLLKGWGISISFVPLVLNVLLTAGFHSIPSWPPVFTVFLTSSSLLIFHVENSYGL